MSHRRKGLFIVFEGGEATGKSTQIALLTQRLQKEQVEVVVTREPGGTALGEKLRSLFKEHSMSALTELFILEAARSEHVTEVIAPALRRGAIVISDRFAESALVYQGLTRGLSLSLVKKLNTIAVQNIRADRIFLLDGSVGWKRLHARGDLDRLEKEGFSFHEKIRRNYRKLAKMDRRILTLRADQEKENLHALIFNDIKKYLQKMKRKR